MNKSARLPLLFLPLAAIAMALFWVGGDSHAQEEAPGPLIVGAIHDAQNQPVQGAQVSLLASKTNETLVETSTQANGRYSIPIPNPLPTEPILLIQRAHFEEVSIPLEPEAIQSLQAGEAVVIHEITLSRQINLAFWIATLVFVAVLALIATASTGT